MGGSIGFAVQEPDFIDNFQVFRIIMDRSNWEKRILADQTMNKEHLKALFTGFGKLNNRLKRAWLNQIDS